MKIEKLLKSRAFKIYVVIGFLVYIIAYLFGLTNAVRVYLEHKTIFSDYVDEIKHIYINNEKDIAMCVKGNTSGYYDIEYWMKIPHSYYNYSEKRFGSGNTGISYVPNKLIEIKKCSPNPANIEKGFFKMEIDIKNFNNQNYVFAHRIFEYEEFNVDKNTMFLVKYSDNDKASSKLIYVNYLNPDQKYSVSLNLETLNFRDRLNPLWKLLYIPAFILDVLLWPLYLVLFLYSTFFGPYPR